MGSSLRNARRLASVIALTALPFACGYPEYGGFDTVPGQDASVEGSAGSGGVLPDGSPDAEASAGKGGSGGQGGSDAGGAAGEAGSGGCSNDNDCTGSPTGGVCDTPNHACVECIPGGAPCPKGTWCADTKKCEPGCVDNSDCLGVAGSAGSSGSAGAAGADDSGAGGQGGEDAGDLDADGTAGAAGDESGTGGAAGEPQDAETEVSDDGGAAGEPADASEEDEGSAGGGGSGNGMTCDIATHTCQGCAVDAQCLPGTVCNGGKCVLGCTPEHDCQSGHTCCSGECANLLTEDTHCGTCGNNCNPANGIGHCNNGQCEVAGCKPGFADCNNSMVDGCEVDLNTDAANCSACGNTCPVPANASSAACLAGKCTIGTCKPAYADCNSQDTDGCEINKLTDPTNCGDCGFLCDLLNANENCKQGECGIETCAANYADCDQVASNGCEVDTQISVNHCGTCGHVCYFENAGALCVTGLCQLDACVPPTADCNNDPSDGCETNKNTSVDNCGDCGNVCSLPNATAECSNGQCAVQSCNAGYADCDGLAANGCEVDTQTDALNCGQCSAACSTNNGTAGCALGSCTIQCNLNFDNCDGKLDNGCETNTLVNVDNCGTCAHKCLASGGTPNCVKGICGIANCSAPFADCDNDATNGCETNTAGSVDNCGGCGLACYVANGTAGCTGGVCNIASCNPGYADCESGYSDGCESPLNTLLNCGACGADCLLPHAKGTCATGTCQVQSCTLPYADCDGVVTNGCEVDGNTNIHNCGTCGNDCNSTNGVPTCQGGSCGIVCAAGFGNCNNSASDGCETSLNNNVNDCGACGAACTVQNGTPTCNGTTCNVLSCTAPFADCDLQYATGCETNTQSSVSNCGSCGHACNSNNGVPSCGSGACQIACNAGFGNCDNNASNGCEINLKIDPLNCNACGTACTFANAQGICVNGACQLGACLPGFGDCDNDPANGCETNIKTSPQHCGVCGGACALPHALNTCTNGTCGFSACTSPWADCDGQVSDGCETDTSTDTSSCGGCGTVCNSTNGTPTCTNSQCAITCNSGYANCDTLLTNGCETNTNADVKNCATCGHVCSTTGGTPNCVLGVCGISSCADGLGDCDGTSSNGCETDLTTSVTNCKTCGNACQVNNGTPACVGSTCTISQCNMAYADCNGLYNDGCETSLKTNTNCGTCGTVCNLPNATESCGSGSCLVSTCNAGYGNCDNNHANGCETITDTNVSHCGTCGNVCSTVHGSASCTAGVCAISCASGFGNCDNDVTNGCETATTSDVSHCGSCTTVCTAAHGTPSCIGTTCTIQSCTAPWKDCNNTVSDGCETDTSTSVANCGTCGSACNGTNGSASCVSSACQITCNPGFGNCDNDVSNGCESNFNTNILHCGNCTTACSYANATALCSSGLCQLGSCNTGYANCDNNMANGCEASLATVANCGACGIACANANGTTSCSSGLCAPVCSAGFGNCDSNLTNGCETSLKTLTDCGSCKAACGFTNATASCATGTCVMSACNAGWGNCDSNTANGCETNTNASTSNCGACGNVCNATNGTASCSGGACGITCNSGWGNCDGNVTNGCETNTSTDVTHCGTCTTVCSFAHASATCFGGACQLGTCSSGWGNCNANATDGCETQLTSLTNCGACGTTCSLANATATCGSGTCQIATCNPNYGNCDGNTANGCETNTQTSTSNCNACGTVCNATNGTPACNSGVCSITCSSGFGNCDGNVGNGCEASLATTANCGTCGTVCSNANGGTSCVGGVCTPSCSAGFASCDGNPNNGCEVNLQTSTGNCGACGISCSNTNGSTSCIAGVCVPVCSGGYGNCDGNPNNGCETNTASSATNCGTCGTTCTNANGSTVCNAGVCTPTCNTGYLNCDGNPNNGCETNKNTSVTNCGTCNNVCSCPGGSPSCVAGVCQCATCNAGWGDCDGNTGNGCETQLNTLTNCATCGTACNLANATSNCSTGSCQIGSCNSSYSNCDGTTSNGCETNTQTNLSNCGTCGNACNSTNGTPSCSLGTCAIACLSGWGNCDGNVGNGCEMSLNTTTNCGACGTSCTNANGSTTCSSGVCTPSCSAGYASCDGNANNGCEANTQTSSINCGACGTACTNSNGSTSCVSGLCTPVCSSGFGNCDGNRNNGCETNTNTSAANCGACGTVCTNANGSTSCASGLCAPLCTSGFGNCDSNLVNGCETNTNTSVTNCGGCGTVCNSTNGTASCTGGACSISCTSGFGNCNGLVSDGCEVPLNTTSNCGACGTACSNSNGSTACVSGACSPTCSSGYGNCDTNPNNGCETALNTLTNCGACGTTCSRANATATCTTGACAIGTCNSGFASCNMTDSDGCETPITTTSNCGACGTTCTNSNGSTACTGGLCVPSCNSGFASCDGNVNNGCETNTQTSMTNCGTCGNVCSFAHASSSCASGACVLGSCDAGWGNCNGLASDGCETPLNTTTNCGTCGTSCTNANGTTQCTSGACNPSCAAFFASCDANLNNGCETALTTLTNCGACGTPCSYPNAVASCSTGACLLSSCNAGFVNCDSLTSNGCEVNSQTDANNCSACGIVCSSNHATPSCSLGACQAACNFGWGNCDGNAQSNGCETELLSNPANCGTCGHVCSGATPTCTNGTCVGGCPLDAWEANETIMAPTDPPMTAAMKPIDSSNNTFNLTQSRTIVIQPTFSSDTDVDVYYLNIVDDNVGTTSYAWFDITLDQIPDGAVYSIDSYFHCAGTNPISGTWNWTTNPACPYNVSYTGYVGAWWHCQKTAAAPSLTYSYGHDCTGKGNKDDSGILQIKVNVITPPTVPTCNPYRLTVHAVWP